MTIIAEILSSKARAEFFRILFGLNTNEMFLREIQRISGLAIGTIRQEAIKLEKLQLIKKRKNGNRTYFGANKKHPLFPEIHTIILKTSGLADLLHQSLSIDMIKIAFVFGSIASGTEKAESDIDLFILGDIGLKALSKLLKEPAKIINREINPHIMTLDEFSRRKKQNEHFVCSVIKSPKIMIKGTENELERLGK